MYLLFILGNLIKYLNWWNVKKKKEIFYRKWVQGIKKTP